MCICFDGGVFRGAIEFDRPESRLSFSDSKLPVDLSKLSLLNDGDSRKVDMLVGACGGFENTEVEKVNTPKMYTYRKTISNAPQF